MSGIQETTFDELNNMKFTVVSRFGVTRNNRKNGRRFFLMETVPPTEYGADCQDYVWWEVRVKTDQDFERLNDFLQRLFRLERVKIPVGKDSPAAAERLEKQIRKSAKVVDFGACHVTYLPIAPEFQKLYRPA